MHSWCPSQILDLVQRPSRKRMDGNSVVDDLLDECSQVRVLLVGSSRGKAQLLREIFGVNRITRYPADFSRDEEIYSTENEYFVAHVFDDWKGVEEVLQRRRRGEPDEVIHCVWHYVDAQDATGLVGGRGEDQACPLEVLRLGVPVITIFGRFDNIVNRAAEIGTKRRLKQILTDADKSDGKQIRKVYEAISLYLLQFGSTTAIASKAPSSKISFLNIVLQCLKKNAQAQMLLIIAQRLNPSIKFETSVSLAMKQFLLGTVSTASPLPIPFAGLIGSQAATYMIKKDIVRVWNIYDPDNLCSNPGGGGSLMDTLMYIPQMGAKRLVYMIPVIGTISGIWETPRLARALGGLMIDLTLLMERAFLATMAGSNDGSSPIRTPKRSLLLSDSPKTPMKPVQRGQYGQNGVKSPLSAEVLRNRQQLISPKPTATSSSPLRHRGVSTNLIDLEAEERPKTPPRPVVGPKPGSSKPPLPAKPTRPSTPLSAAQHVKPSASVPSGMPALELSTPASKAVVDITIRPSSLPLTSKMLETIVQEYAPIKEAVKLELEDFFNQEGEGLKRSFQKDTVRSKIDEIVHGWRLSEVVDLA